MITLDRSTYTQSIVDPDNGIIYGRHASENEDEKLQRIYQDEMRRLCMRDAECFIMPDLMSRP